jgi:hypothetical protein
VLFLVFGSSASGKTTAMELVRKRVAGLAVHDFDEVEPPAGASVDWRHRANEHWLRRALEYQLTGRDLLLAGQTPFGELLATPSATRLEAISGCLIDCDDATRAARLEGRGLDWFDHTAGDLQAVFSWPEWIQQHINWADWIRRHANDPTWRQDVIRVPASEDAMHWERWVDWQAGDPRWRTRIIDTSTTPPDQVADALVDWIEQERWLVRAGHHPLMNWAD